ncbi:HTH-type transcriptional repressor PurR [compost metagenome]
MKAMEEQQLEVKPEWVFHQELTPENAMAAMQQMFGADMVPDALFADNDTTAIAAIEFAKEKGIAVPSSLKVAGYSNDPRTAIITPPITSVEQFPDTVGKRIVEAVVDLLSEDAEKPVYISKSVVVPVQLISRMSTSTINKNK